MLRRLVVVFACGLAIGCQAPPEEEKIKAEPAIKIDFHYHVASERGRTIYSFDHDGQILAGGQLAIDNRGISGPVPVMRECEEVRIGCSYAGFDPVPVALSADADEIKWFYEFRNFSADVIIEDECATAEVSSGPIAMKRYQFCQLRGLVWSEALPASGRPARIELLDNCGIRSAPECETAVPPVPLALPRSADRFAPPGPSG